MRSQEVIVLAVKNEDIDTYLCELHNSGATIESLEFQPAAIYRSVERFIRRRDDEQEVHVLVDVGPRRTQVMIGRGREISFYKAIDIGGHHFHENVARKLGIDDRRSGALRQAFDRGGRADVIGKRVGIGQERLPAGAGKSIGASRFAKRCTMRRAA